MTTNQPRIEGRAAPNVHRFVRKRRRPVSISQTSAVPVETAETRLDKLGLVPVEMIKSTGPEKNRVARLRRRARAMGLDLRKGWGGGYELWKDGGPVIIPVDLDNIETYLVRRRELIEQFDQAIFELECTLRLQAGEP